ncbi:MAG: lipoyl(octanoyl) transferase [Elusimicrobia bacterium RIFCSPHIGHO2_02_FULL_57_9]|nr:MAG: lipoyl(octanoyl) transferase [Elusimicrobia bacterium RIFCSPHIGHO2_02_FULL_57_9]
MLVRVLGSKAYAEAWEIQKRLVEQRRREEIPDTLLLLEHPPVYTTGRSSKSPIPQLLPYPVYRVERGGDMTYHGPGQLVGYPIFHLGKRGLRPRSYLQALETVLIAALGTLGFKGETLRGFTGVWCQGKKIASIGVGVKDQISYHGFALNVNCELEPFARIHPCRLQPEQISSLAALRGRAIDEDKVLHAVADAFIAYLDPVTFTGV